MSTWMSLTGWQIAMIWKKLKTNGYPNLYTDCEFLFEIRYPYKPYIL